MVVSAGQFIAASRRPAYPAQRSIALNGRRATYEAIYRAQPAVRTVIGFLARNVAGIGLHLYERREDDNRVRVRSGILADALATPFREAKLTQYAWVYRIVADLALYDEHYTVVSKTDNTILLMPVPVREVTPVGGTFYAPDGYKIWGHTIPADNVLSILGYSPTSLTEGVSPIESLRAILAADAAAEQHREDFWARGAKISGVLSRPADAPQWSSDAQAKFRRQWKARYGTGGEDAGGTPILEDGMTYEQLGMTAKDAQYVESRKLTREEVSAIYYIAPPMVGILDNANYSNVKQFHTQLYQDTLGPTLQQIDQSIDMQLGYYQRGTYAEFNIMGKLAGSFEEQAQILSRAVGGPWMTRNEARARMNMPLIDGGDELIVPLNVIQGGLANPTDTDPTDPKALPAEPVHQKAEPVTAVATDRDITEMVKTLRSVFARQERVLRAKGKAISGFDRERWDHELADDLLKTSMRVAAGPVENVRRKAGLDHGVLSTERMRGWLAAKADAMADAINTETELRLLTGDDDPFPTERNQTALNMALAVVGFAFIDAAKQADYGTKTWIVTSGNSRHPGMNGETVPIDGVFSNGARWPGDSSAGAGESAHCQCELLINPKG